MNPRSTHPVCRALRLHPEMGITDPSGLPPGHTKDHPQPPCCHQSHQEDASQPPHLSVTTTGFHKPLLVTCRSRGAGREHHRAFHQLRPETPPQPHGPRGNCLPALGLGILESPAPPSTWPIPALLSGTELLHQLPAPDSEPLEVADSLDFLFHC